MRQTISFTDSKTQTLRIGDTTPPPNLTNLPAIASRTADPPVAVPTALPTRQRKPKSSLLASQQPRFAESSIYPYLETNVDDVAMSFTGGGLESIPDERSAWSIAMHGADTPFRHWQVLKRYVAELFNREGYGALVEYGTCVEKIVKEGGEWVLTLRKEVVAPSEAEKGSEVEEKEEEWWTERFDGIVVASGHFNVPWIPAVEGLEEFEKARPGSVLHSKMFRGRDAFQGKVSFVLKKRQRTLGESALANRPVISALS